MLYIDVRKYEQQWAFFKTASRIYADVDVLEFLCVDFNTIYCRAVMNNFLKCTIA